MIYLLTDTLLVSSTQIFQVQGWKMRNTVPLKMKWIRNLHQSFLMMTGGGEEVVDAEVVEFINV